MPIPPLLAEPEDPMARLALRLLGWVIAVGLAALLAGYYFERWVS